MNASFTTIAAVLVSAAIVFPARADDYGPHPDIRAIRSGLPVLLAYPLKNAGVAASAEVDAVVISGDDALAAWHAGAIKGMAVMHRRSDRWWLSRNVNSQPGFPEQYGDVTIPTGDLPGCTPFRSFGIFETIALARSVPAPLARLGVAHGVLPPETLPSPTPTPGGNVRPGKIVECAVQVPPPTVAASASDGGVAILQTASGISGTGINGRAPTVGEMPPAPGMNAYYFFRVSSSGTAPVKVRGATLDVWFPYVLDASRGYALWLDFLRPDIDGLTGTLHDNVLHFVLPDFETIPGKEAFGEIDGA